MVEDVPGLEVAYLPADDEPQLIIIHVLHYLRAKDDDRVLDPLLTSIP